MLKSKPICHLVLNFVYSSPFETQNKKQSLYHNSQIACIFYGLEVDSLNY